MPRERDRCHDFWVVAFMTCMDREFELALVARLRAGDTSAFDVVHEWYNRPLFNFLARLTRRRDIAEDLLEDPPLQLSLSRIGKRYYWLSRA